MSRTEADLRDALRAHPGDLATETRLAAFAAGLDGMSPRRLRTWLVPIAAAVAVLIPVTTVLAIRSGQHHGYVSSPPTASGHAPSLGPQPNIPQPPAPNNSPATALFDRSWTLVQWPGYFGSPAPARLANPPATIAFDGVGGWLFSGFCGSGGGSADVDTATMQIVRGFFIHKACAPSTPANSQQAALDKITGSRMQWKIQAGELSITAADGTTLVFDEPTGTAARIWGPGDLSV